MDFDTFEFAGILAPGFVVVLAILLLLPALPKADDFAMVITIAALASYVVGHLIAAIGNLVQPLFERLGIIGLEAISYDAWITNGYMSSDQKKRLRKLVSFRLYRTISLKDAAYDARKSMERRTLVKQMYLAVIGSGGTQRVSTFDGLYSLSRGLAVSLFIAASLALYRDQLWAAAACIAGTGLAVYRMHKFKHAFSRELLQQFLLLELPAMQAGSVRKASIGGKWRAFVAKDSDSDDALVPSNDVVPVQDGPEVEAGDAVTRNAAAVPAKKRTFDALAQLGKDYQAFHALMDWDNPEHVATLERLKKRMDDIEARGAARET
jgi:hypothetical protein